MVSKKALYGINNSFKYFIGYNDNDVVRPLLVKLPQTTSYINKFKDKKTKKQQQQCLLWLKINNFLEIIQHNMEKNWKFNWKKIW